MSDCPVNRTVYGNPCDGPGTYYCDSEAWGSECRRYFEQRKSTPIPGGDATAEAREQIARAIAGKYWERALGDADAVLATPAVAEALAAVDGQCGPLVRALDQAIAQRDELRAAVERVRAIKAGHQPVPAEDVGPGGPYPRDMCSCGEQFYDDCDVRRALDGEP